MFPFQVWVRIPPPASIKYEKKCLDLSQGSHMNAIELDAKQFNQKNIFLWFSSKLVDGATCIYDVIMIFPHRSVSTRASRKLSMRRIEQNLKEAYWDISQCVLIQLMDLLWSGVKLISLFLSDEYSFSTRPDLTQIHLTPKFCHISKSQYTDLKIFFHYISKYSKISFMPVYISRDI